jgi:hypothetical protein
MDGTFLNAFGKYNSPFLPRWLDSLSISRYPSMDSPNPKSVSLPPLHPVCRQCSIAPPGVSHGYWDYPVEQLGPGVDVRFVKFFDFDQKAYADNQYVMGLAISSSSDPELTNRFALIEARYVDFIEAEHLEPHLLRRAD